MAASLGARLLGRPARSSLLPPFKVCGAPGRLQGFWRAETPRPGLLGGLFGIPPDGSDGRSQPRAACTRFLFYRAPFHLQRK